MKSKTHVAYEPESSVTIRHTPSDIGVLVSKIPNERFDEFLSSLLQESSMLGQPRRTVLRSKLIDFCNKLYEVDHINQTEALQKKLHCRRNLIRMLKELGNGE